MTISADYAPNIDVGNGVTTVFAVNFPFAAASDLLVTLYNIAAAVNLSPAPVLNGSGTYDYSVSGTPNADTGIYPSGSITFNNAPPATYKVVRERVTAKRQNTALGNNGPFPAKTVEGSFDRAEMQIQEAAETFGRAAVAPAAVQPANMLIPLSFFAGGKILTYDPIGKALTAADPNAASAAASLAAFQALIATYGSPIATFRNILELFTTAEIAIIKAGDNSTDLTAKVQTAMTANPNTTWFWPAGTYFLNNTLSLPAGIGWEGAGMGVTTIKLGGDWGIEQLNPNGTNTVKGFSAAGITFKISNNGIRLNSTSGGYTDTISSQYYILRPFFSECEFLYNSATAGKTLLQWNKTFNGSVRDCFFNGGAVQLNLEGCDICAVYDNRFDNASDGAILDRSQGTTFGTKSRYEHNDINNPKNYAIRYNNRDMRIVANHIELDFLPGSSGTGGKMEAVIDCLTGGASAFHTHIEDNIINAYPYADYWFRYNSNNPYSLVCINNHTPSLEPGIIFTQGYLPYFTNTGNRMMCLHKANVDSDAYFPMNYDGPTDFNCMFQAAYLSASRQGVYNAVGLGAILNGVKCRSGDFWLAADANAGHYIEFSEWIGFPANNLAGTFTIVLCTYGDIASQTLSWQLLDNATSIATGTIVHATVNQLKQTTICTSQVFASTLRLRIWNADTGHGGNCFMRFAEVRFG